jgi:hypothetical protein
VVDEQFADVFARDACWRFVESVVCEWNRALAEPA